MQGVSETQHSMGLMIDGNRHLKGVFNKTVRAPLLTWQNLPKDGATPAFEDFVKTGYLPAEQ